MGVIERDGEYRERGRIQREGDTEKEIEREGGGGRK